MLDSFFKIDNLHFRSDFIGDTIYNWLNKETGVIGIEQDIVPILSDDQGRKYYVRLFNSSQEEIDKLKRIMNLEFQSFYNSPVDLILISQDNQDFLENCHSIFSRIQSENDRTQLYGLLYPIDKQKELKTLSLFLSDLRNKTRSEGIYSVNWRKPEIIEISRNIIKVLSSLSREGWYFYEIDTKKIFIDDEFKVFIDFTLHIDTQNSMLDLQSNSLPLQFHYPNFQGEISCSRFANYGLCALLFYLFYGRFPYEGPDIRILENDTNIYRVQDSLRKHYENPNFIFSDYSKDTQLLFEEDKESLIIWESSPDKLQFIFFHILSTYFYSAPFPSEWEEYIKEF